jgi:hypothetical protein
VVERLAVDGSLDFIFCCDSRWRVAGTTYRARVTRKFGVQGLYNPIPTL